MVCLRLCFWWCHPADTGAAWFGQNCNATDTRHIEDWPHQFGAGGLCLLHARVDIIDRQIGHPAFRYAVELRTGQRENTADILVPHFGNPIGAVGHWHRVETPADSIAVELLRLVVVASHQLVPVEMSVPPFVEH